MAKTSPDPKAFGSPYEGQALSTNEIRLLTIKPFSKTSKKPEWWAKIGTNMNEQGRRITRRNPEMSIELQTHQHELTEDLDYDAVSYVWGSAPASVMIVCNNGPLFITPTALQMLHYLHRYRKSGRRRKIWIDAICINQGDQEEKSNQIPLMRNIYSWTTNVIVWMGPSTPETDVFFAEFQDVREKFKNWIALYKADPDCRDPVEEELPCYEHAFFKGLTQLLKNEWFRRLWTYQEIILPPKATLLCGDSWADFDGFLDFIIRAKFRSTYFVAVSYIGRSVGTNTALSTCYSIHFHRETTSPRERINIISQNFAVDLDELRYRHVKEPVDRVWAVVGLLKRDLRDKVASGVDYSEQGRVEYWKTWIMFSKALIDTPGGMDLLNIPPTLDPRPSNLPSWCPSLSGASACHMMINGQWNYAIDNRSWAIRWALFEENSEVDSAERVKAIDDQDKRFMSTVKYDNLLRMRGFVLETIEEVVEHEEVLDIRTGFYDSCSEEHMTLYDIAVGRHMDSLDLARRVYHGKSGGVTDIPEDFIIALFLDHQITEKARSVYSEVLPKLVAWHSPYRGAVSWEQAHCRQQWVDMRGHTFFSTKGGRIGFAHPGCKPGDQVAAFYGGEALYILRQLNPTKGDIDSTGQACDHVQYMGAAFIPHLMEQHQRDAARMGPDTLFMIH